MAIHAHRSVLHSYIGILQFLCTIPRLKMKLKLIKPAQYTEPNLLKLDQTLPKFLLMFRMESKHSIRRKTHHLCRELGQGLCLRVSMLLFSHVIEMDDGQCQATTLAFICIPPSLITRQKEPLSLVSSLMSPWGVNQQPWRGKFQHLPYSKSFLQPLLTWWDV